MLDTDGPQQLCGTSEAVYIAKRNKGCSNPVKWTSKSAGMMVDALSDSSALVRFLQPGNYMLYSSLLNGCDTIFDTLRIAYTGIGNSSKPDLGPDLELCPQNNILLNAKQGYSSYQWQNGSGDSTFLVSQPGKYYVTVTDACLNTFNDTVIVSAAPAVTVNIGPDRSKCNNDTLRLVAPAGFINYSWGPAYNLSSANTQSVIVNPAKDTFYFVKAEKTPGCYGYDTVYVKVKTSPPILLGSDLRFCEGDSSLLQAGPGFADYQWNNGARSPQLLVKTLGTYSVKATTADGCSSADTLKVLQPFKLPLVQLNKDSLLCSQSSRILNAGSFNSYSWNTGEVTQTITVNTTGTFFVIVTDANGCKGTDTTRVTKLLPLPSRFLGADTSICNYSKLDLKGPPGYSRYLWNNGITTANNSIQNPGTYELRVTDNNNCSGSDSINVALKQCMSGFFIPNAFTPNNDGLNEEFKPFLFGDVLQYSFSIYNRFGELVFTTANVQNGWNGTIKGWPQDPGIFVWKCLYQLAGEQPQQRKGTLLLVR